MSLRRQVESPVNTVIHISTLKWDLAKGLSKLVNHFLYTHSSWRSTSSPSYHRLDHHSSACCTNITRLPHICNHLRTHSHLVECRRALQRSTKIILTSSQPGGDIRFNFLTSQLAVKIRKPVAASHRYWKAHRQQEY